MARPKCSCDICSYYINKIMILISIGFYRESFYPPYCYYCGKWVGFNVTELVEEAKHLVIK